VALNAILLFFKINFNFCRKRLLQSYVADDLGWPLTTLNYLNFYVLRCPMHVHVTAYGRQTAPDRGVVRLCDPLTIFVGCNHITNVVKFCTEVGYIKSRNRMTYHPQKGRGYGHVTVIKFCSLPWCSASRGFVRDSYATYLNFAVTVISLECAKISIPNVYCWLIVKWCGVYDRLPPKWICSWSRVLFKFWEITDNLSESV